jgi:WD40 repeat protein
MIKNTKQTYQHDVYICFGKEDGELAEIIESLLSSYLLHKEMGFPHRHLNVFVDSPEVVRSGHGDIFIYPLQHSHKFLVIYTSNSINNEQINEQIREFLEERGPEDVIALQVKHTLSEPDLLPEALTTHKAKIKHIAIEINQLRVIEENQQAFYPTNVKIISAVSGFPEEQILQWDKQRQITHRKRHRFLIVAGILLIFTTVVLLWLNERHKSSLEYRTSTAVELLKKSELAALDNNPLLRLHLLAAAISQKPEKQLMNSLSSLLKEAYPLTRFEKKVSFPTAVNGVKLSPDSSRLLIFGGNTIYIWNRPNGNLELTTNISNSEIIDAVWKKDDIILCWCKDGEISTTNVLQRKTTELFQQPSEIIFATPTPDFRRLITASSDFTIRIWDLETHTVLNEIEMFGWVSGAAFSPKKTEGLVWSDDSTAFRFDISTGKKIGKTIRMPGAINGGQYHPNQSKILLWDTDGSAWQWQLNQQQFVNKTIHHAASVISATYIDNGKRILTTSADQTAVLWDSESGAKLIPPMKHEGWVLGAAYHPSNGNILTWSFDNSARWWQINPFKLLNTLQHHRQKRTASSSGVFWGGISSTGQWLLTGGSDGAFRLWPAGSSIEGPVAVMQHNPNANEVQQHLGALFLDNDHNIVTWNGDSDVKFWKLLPNANQSLHIDPNTIVKEIEKITDTRLSIDGSSPTILILD